MTILTTKAFFKENPVNQQTAILSALTKSTSLSATVVSSMIGESPED